MESQSVKLYGQEIAIPKQLAREHLPSGDTIAVENTAKLLLNKYMEIAREGMFISNAHKEKVTEFFKTIGVVNESLEEIKNLSTEDMTLPNNTSLYTTILRALVEKEFRPLLVARNVIKSISVNPSGMKDLQVPVGALRTATDLPDNGVLTSPSNDNYTDVKIALKWIYAYEVITYQTIRQGIIDIIADQMDELAFAINNKVDTDILEAFEAASPSNGSNANYDEIEGGLSYAALNDAIFDMEENNATATAIITRPAVFKDFMKDTDVKGIYKFSTVDKGSIFPRVLDFMGTEIFLTTKASENNVYLIDSGRTGYFVEASGIEFLDGRKSGTVNWEIVALKLYGVKVVKPKSVYRLVVNQGSP